MTTISEELYFAARNRLLSDTEYILYLERFYMDFLLGVVHETADDIFTDLSVNTFKLSPFWRNYPPEQRGRSPVGDSVPWIEVGEKTIGSHLIKEITKRRPDVTFPGLPTGGDVRYSTEDAFIHLDIKLTGPRDNPDEVVVPPNQVSGDGCCWNEFGVVNSNCPVNYVRRPTQLNYCFQPKLPPLYLLDGRILVCLTFFLKAVYVIDERTKEQPFQYFELACVPNGLLLFEGERLSRKEGLIIAGKDDSTTPDESKRIRIRLTPLARIAEWRSIKVIRRSDGRWTIQPRIAPNQPTQTDLF